MARTNQKLIDKIGLKKYPASEKKFSETVLFVHFFDGSPLLIRRHIDFVNELGYDAYAYQVGFHLTTRTPMDLIAPKKRMGFKNLWTKDVSVALDHIPGKKIVYAFSNPASAAMDAMAQRFEQKNYDVVAMVCDSGPFVDMLKCSYNLGKHYYEIKNPLLNLPFSISMAFLLAPFHAQNLHKDLAKFPNDFPILSIRGWKDELVPVKAIEKVFEPHGQIDLQSLVLPEAGHLNGLKDFGDKYKPVTSEFLRNHSTKV
jgi:pimeloyl-ACP methyl ester carboxylesterase